MPRFDFTCLRCRATFEEIHRMSEIPGVVECQECGGKAERVFSTPAFSTRGDDLVPGGGVQYCPGLARKMPYNRPDPQANFTSKTAAREAARRKADKDGLTLELD